ncbi:MAG: hypothetical protein A2271_05135 [Candidatus Moranbacteria bacterium RIFOXYA12_FULL_35_19]|nr:MAG: hypothetical protein UR78_C0018G0005 [Candidatus Moranbacteria bacterium GW2011_GWF2_35_39]OGI31002.1 MAG: hypothetical protein A2343_01945 [Candidatus Moranbacteria bacterium RIFOXYB12_FULL_35_8]OGI32124.1 MAG: hypothetical protein A2489_02095 [Candidatus Moranbacteria bacterium RIFOXYC12_FULL_36_13]OGI35092.1 MAG: hypothetical protein A2271_05135 [Candidatus Moranbacteria bacterium RIFOXYA12_FULL_35_19]
MEAKKYLNKKFLIGTSMLVAVAGLVGSTLYVSAYQGDPNVKGPNYTAERHTAMIKAFENKDYNAWKELMAGRGRATQVINEGNFSRFAEAHKLALEGKMDEAKKIRTELGLGLRNGDGQGRGMGRGANCNR